MSTVNISLTLKQAEVVEKALDFFSRIGCGQLEEIERMMFFYNLNNKYITYSKSMQDSIEMNIKNIKTELGLNNNSNIGITNASHDFKIAYDIEQVLKQKLAYNKNEKRDFSNYKYDDTMPITNEKLCKIEIVK